MDLSNIHKLLLIRLSSLGDVLLTTPLIRAVKKQNPQVNIDFVVNEQFADLLSQNPRLRKIYRFNPENSEKLSKLLNENAYDTIIDLQNNFRSKRLLKKINAPVSRFNKRDIEKFLLVHFKINRLKNAPPIPVRYAQTIDKISLDNKGLELFTNKQANSKLNSSEKFIGLCPGAKHFTKMWPEDYFLELARLLEKNNFSVVLFGGRDDKLICDEIESKLESALNLCNDNDILQTAADMIRCKVIYCNDSGLMHTATAVNVPVITFFGSTVKEFGFTPYKTKSIILENNSLTCRPCTHIGKDHCPKKHFKCMMELTPEMAFEKLKILTV